MTQVIKSCTLLLIMCNISFIKVAIPDICKYLIILRHLKVDIPIVVKLFEVVTLFAIKLLKCHYLIHLNHY
jgi:hypothetical protein